LGALLVAKLLATSITVGSGGSGGVFAPSLFLGAMTAASSAAGCMQYFRDHGNLGRLRARRDGCSVAATTHAPITAIVMIFEMTQTIRIIPPLMTACVISTLMATFLTHESIYTMKLVRRGVPSARGSASERSAPPACARRHEPRRGARVAFDAARRDSRARGPQPAFEFYVVDDRGDLLGAISLSALRSCSSIRRCCAT